MLPVFCLDSVSALYNSHAPSCSLDSWSYARTALFDPETSIGSANIVPTLETQTQKCLGTVKCVSPLNTCFSAHKAQSEVHLCSLHAPSGAASGAVITEVTSASMSMSLGHGVTVAAAVMTTGGNADSALADVLDRMVPAPTSRWAAMIEEAPVRVNFAS